MRQSRVKGETLLTVSVSTVSPRDWVDLYQPVTIMKGSVTYIRIAESCRRGILTPSSVMSTRAYCHNLEVRHPGFVFLYSYSTRGLSVSVLLVFKDVIRESGGCSAFCRPRCLTSRVFHAAAHGSVCRAHVYTTVDNEYSRPPLPGGHRRPNRKGIRSAKSFYLVCNLWK